MTSEQIIAEIFESIVSGERTGVQQRMRNALERGLTPEVILQEGMIPAMGRVGSLFEQDQYFLPEMLLAASTMKECMQVLKPHLGQTGVMAKGKIVVGTVQGDMHDIGKNLVGMMLEGAGFEVCDLGTDVSPARFVQAVRDEHADVLALSALLTTTMVNMGSVIVALEEAGLRDHVKVIVGGAPITEAFAKQVRADAYAPDASRAVRTVSALMPAN